MRTLRGLGQTGPLAPAMEPAETRKEAQNGARPAVRTAHLNRRTALLIGAMTLGGSVLTAIAGWNWDGQHLTALLMLAALAIIAERFDVSLYGESSLSLTCVPVISAVFIAGVAGLIFVIPAAVLTSQVGRGKPLHRGLFNFGALMLSGGAAAAVLQATGYVGQPEAWPQVLGPSLAATGANFLVNSGLVAIAIGFSSGTSVKAVWEEKFRWLWPHYLILGVLGLAIATGYQLLGLWGIAIFLGPPLMMRYSIKQYLDRTTKSVTQLRETNQELKEAHRQVVATIESLQRAYSGTLGSLIAALDTRDAETRGHSERVAELALAIAAEMGIERDGRLWQDLHWGALLHDVGKIGVPDKVLRKPTALTRNDWERMKMHPAAGHEILKGVEFLAGAAEIVYCHHERYDGKGYPRGLRGEDIPLGARIFAVVDAFDAMTAGRPYRAAKSPLDAMVEALHNCGSQFDPKVVAAFLPVYQERFVAGPLTAVDRENG